MKKRIIAMLLIAATVVSTMIGCGKTTEEPAAEQPASAEEVSEEEVAEVEEVIDPLGKYEEEITLRGAWVNMGAPTAFYPGNEGYESAEDNLYITAYKEKLGINVVYDWVSADLDAYGTKWNMAMAQNNLPDFGMVEAEQYQMLLDAGLVMDMTDIFEQYASDRYKEFLAADGGATRGYSTVDGRLMGLPYTGAQPDYISIFFIRKDWLDELELEVPKTIDEVVSTAQAFVDNKMGGENTYGLAGSADAFGLDLSFEGFLNGYGAYPDAWIMDDSGEIIYGSTADENKAALLKLQEMYSAGLINKDFSVSPNSVVKEDVAAGEVGIVYGTFTLASGVVDSVNANPDAEWVVAEVPTVDGSAAYAQSAVVREKFLFVNKDCEHPEAVVKMINLELELMNNEDQTVVEQYTTHVGPTGEKVQVSRYVAGVTMCSKPWTNWTRHVEATKALETGVEDFSIALSKTTYDNLLKYKDGDETQYSTWMIFGPESTFSVVDKMKSEDRIILDQYQATPTETMNEKKAVLKEALEAAMIKVIMGEDISTYEKAVEEWYANGGQTMTDEVNEWYKANH